MVGTPRSLGRNVIVFFFFFFFYPSFRYRKLPIITPLLIPAPPPPIYRPVYLLSRYRLPPNISPALACIKMNFIFYDVLLGCARAPLSQVTNNAHNRVFILFYFFTCLSYRELYAVKSLEHKCSLQFKSVWIFSTKYLLESILVVLFRGTLTSSFTFELTGL